MMEAESFFFSQDVPYKNVFFNGGQMCDGLTAYLMQNGQEDVVVFIADKATVFEADNGIPIAFPSEGIYVALAFNPDTLTTINHFKLEISWGTVKTIDPKFLPGVCLPMLELTTTPTKDGVLCTESENAALDEVAATKLPCIIRNPQGAMVYGYLDGEDGGYLVNRLDEVLAYVRAEAGSGTWMAVIP